MTCPWKLQEFYGTIVEILTRQTFFVQSCYLDGRLIIDRKRLLKWTIVKTATTIKKNSVQSTLLKRLIPDLAILFQRSIDPHVFSTLCSWRRVAPSTTTLQAVPKI